MAKIQLRNNWETATPYKTIIPHIIQYFNQNNIKIALQKAHLIIGKQGSKFKAGFYGNKILDYSLLPKKISISITPNGQYNLISVFLEEDFGIKSSFTIKSKYRESFQHIMGDLISLFPINISNNIYSPRANNPNPNSFNQDPKILEKDQNLIRNIQKGFKMTKNLDLSQRKKALKELINLTDKISHPSLLKAQVKILQNLENDFDLLEKKENKDDSKIILKRFQNILKMSKKILIDDISDVLRINRSDLLNIFFEKPDMMQGYRIEGDYIIAIHENATDGDVEHFMSGLDGLFSDWEGKEITKEGKK